MIDRIVLAADPGIRHVGFGVVGRRASKFELVDHGEISTKSDADLNDRLRVIWQAVARLCRDYRPALLGVENQAGAIIGARQRGEQNAFNDQVLEVVGAIKAAAFSYAIPVMLYSPQQAKIAVLGHGNGNAKKAAVMGAVRAIFKGAIEQDGQPLGEHEADAIAGAVYCERVTYLSARAQRRKAG